MTAILLEALRFPAEEWNDESSTLVNSMVGFEMLNSASLFQTKVVSDKGSVFDLPKSAENVVPCETRGMTSSDLLCTRGELGRAS